MSLYAVKNDNGEWLNVVGRDGLWGANGTGIATEEQAEARSELFGGTVVELVENPAPIVVSEEEADMLEQAKDDYCAASVISDYSTEHIGAMGQDRLMRAYVIGWTVEKPKRWNVKVPHTKHLWYYKSLNEDLRTISVKELCSEFTEAEIEHYGLQDCDKKEVTDDDE